MRRLLFTSMVAVMAVAGSAAWRAALAAGDSEWAGPGSLALGYHDPSTPLGVRYWFSSGKVGLDVGFGMNMDRVVLSPQGTTSNLFGYAISVGIPYQLKDWGKFHVLIRPGGSFGQQDEIIQQLTNTIDPSTFDAVAKRTSFAGRLEVEAEYFLVQRFSVSLSQGAEFTTSRLNVASDIRNVNISTTATDASISCHLYLWGVQ